MTPTNETYEEMIQRHKNEREDFKQNCKHENLYFEELYGYYDEGTVSGVIHCVACGEKFDIDKVNINELCQWLLNKQKETGKEQ